MSALTGSRVVELAGSVAGEYGDWPQRHPDVVFCSITPFGQGAAAEFGNAASINVFHASGWGYHMPSHPDPAKPPLRGPGNAERLARRLRAAGVPACKSATALDVIGDQRLWDRGLYRFVSDHREGQRPIVGPSWRMARDQARIARGAPDLGEHTEYVLHGILGAPTEAAGSTTGGT
ncbi:hypothetical protein BRW65_20955 [Mycobacterium paraffinicum]|uniref:Uncharacterized protein n=1 Tax=Mycobacterium paraffinicum TaxID=53378 RepID=A0A1Q4HQA8_9MYCO|nr:CoA transferase [Mycobacterium paraffinicum]OJZ70214.1 hypothetical protein BRW65_20955 [Mycobacterium paraffinicum]